MKKFVTRVITLGVTLLAITSPCAGATTLSTDPFVSWQVDGAEMRGRSWNLDGREIVHSDYHQTYQYYTDTYWLPTGEQLIVQRCEVSACRTLPGTFGSVVGYIVASKPWGYEPPETECGATDLAGAQSADITQETGCQQATTALRTLFRRRQNPDGLKCTTTRSRAVCKRGARVVAEGDLISDTTYDNSVDVYEKRYTNCGDYRVIGIYIALSDGIPCDVMIRAAGQQGYAVSRAGMARPPAPSNNYDWLPTSVPHEFGIHCSLTGLRSRWEHPEVLCADNNGNTGYIDPSLSRAKELKNSMWGDIYVPT